MILVDIYVPSIDNTFDFRVDETASVENIIHEVSEMLCKKYRNSLNKNANDFVLCSYETEAVMPNNSTLTMHGIKNGSKLILV